MKQRSRYARTAHVDVPSPNGETRTLVGIREITIPPAGHLHLTRAGDRIDLLAHRFYRDARRFWRVADASDELDPFEVVNAGELLAIPPDA
jgi:hypothetical protein